MSEGVDIIVDTPESVSTEEHTAAAEAHAEAEIAHAEAQVEIAEAHAEAAVEIAEKEAEAAVAIAEAQAEAVSEHNGDLEQCLARIAALELEITSTRAELTELRQSRLRTEAQPEEESEKTLASPEQHEERAEEPPPVKKRGVRLI